MNLLQLQVNMTDILQKIKCFLGLHTFDWHATYQGFSGKQWVVQCPYCLEVKAETTDQKEQRGRYHFMMRKRQDDCEFLHNMEGSISAYMWAEESESAMFCKCLAKTDAECPKKSNKRNIAHRCWYIEKYAREKYVCDTVRNM